MKKKILDFMERYQMTKPGDVVCVGLSGGADSVFLLLALLELAEKLSIQLQAVHVNHGLRGEESDQDQAFVEKFCRERGIPLFVYARPVREIASEKHMGLEEAGRLVRREAYQDCLERHGVDRIALAHHRNDLAETMLFHLARGTSLAGMASIRPVNGAIIRPLLGITREEIENDLDSRGVVWRTDSSNLADDYTRNGIRHQVIPYLESHVNEKTVGHMAEAAGDLEAADHFLRQEAEKRMEKLVKEEDGKLLISERLLEEPEILQGYVILECMQRLAGARKDLTREHVLSVRELLTRQTGKKVCLPCGISGVRDYQGVSLEKGRKKEGSVCQTEELTEEKLASGDWRFTFGRYEITCRIFERNNEKIPEKAYTKWLDYDKIKNSLVMRTRKPGDYLMVHASGGCKKLKDYMIDRKIPQQERDSVPLLASGSEVFWVVGYRISESCKIGEHTKRVLQLEITGGKAHG